MSSALHKNLHIPTYSHFLESDLVGTSQGQESPEPSTASDRGNGLNKKIVELRTGNVKVRNIMGIFYIDSYSFF